MEKSTSDTTSNSTIRQNLVNTAVRFLLNPDIINSEDTKKVSFLKNKGLTDTEIAAAFDQVKRESSVIPNNSLNPTVPSTIPYASEPPLWLRVRRISSTIIIFGAALYGLHHLYKVYIEPWLFGRKDQISQIQDELHKVNNAVQQLQSTISVLDDSIKSQKGRLDMLTEESAYLSAPAALAQLKTEISNVKSLLINRHQFPTVPNVSSPTIPVWQLSKPQAETSKSDSDNSNDEKDKHVVSLNPPIDALVSDVAEITSSDDSNITGLFNRAESQLDSVQELSTKDDDSASFESSDKSDLIADNGFVVCTDSSNVIANEDSTVIVSNDKPVNGCT